MFRDQSHPSPASSPFWMKPRARPHRSYAQRSRLRTVRPRRAPRPGSYGSRTLNQRRLAVFCHLLLTLTRLAERIEWQRVTPADRQRAERLINELAASVPAAACKNSTTKAASHEG